MRRLNKKTRVDKKNDELLASRTSASYVPKLYSVQAMKDITKEVNDI